MIMIKYPESGATITRPHGQQHIIVWGTNDNGDLLNGYLVNGVAQNGTEVERTFWMMVIQNPSKGKHQILHVGDQTATEIEIADASGVAKDNNNPTIQTPNETNPEPSVTSPFGTGGSYAATNPPAHTVCCELRTKDGVTTLGSSKDGTMTQHMGPPLDTSGMWGFQVTYSTRGEYTIYVATYDSNQNLIGSALGAPFKIT